MTKWADFLISAVAYDSKHQILYAKQHKDTGESLSDGVLVDRNTLISNLKKGISYVTIFGTNSTWKKGSSLRTYRIGGEYFIRVDGNNVRLDNLGQLPELEIPKETKIDEKKEAETTSKSLSARESLPKGFGKTSPEQRVEEEDATPEQIARLEELEKQIQKIESPSIPPPSPRGSLPKGFGKTSPEQRVEEEDATPEQIARLEELEKQIQKIENYKQSPVIPIKRNEHKLDAEIDQQFSRLSKIEQRIQKINEIKIPNNGDLISYNKIQEYVEKLSTLNNQIRELEKGLQKIRKKEPQDENSNSTLDAYCVKCKAKRNIKDAQQTTMKNNKPAIRGTCSVCGTKVFRIGKILK